MGWRVINTVYHFIYLQHTYELQIVIINFLKLPKTSIQTYRKAI